MDVQTVEIQEENILTGWGHSSKGNQLKWKVGDWWYKADAFGYEGLAEVTASHMLEFSNTDNILTYEPVNILYRGRTYRGCKSRNFRKAQEEIITLERLSRSYTGFSLARELSRIADVQQKILYTTELVENVTGLEGFGEYLAVMLEMDAFFLNEDRHTNNIALIYDLETKSYRFCPFFDMGLSLFSDTREAYPLTLDIDECRSRIEGKPFSRDFDEQLDAVNELYGNHLKFHCSMADIESACGAAEGYYNEEELKRVSEVLRYQMRKYQYMFCS